MNAGAARQLTERSAPVAPPRSPLVVVCGVLLLSLSAVLAAWLEVLLVPLYIGGTVFPIAVPLAVLTTIGLPVLARQLGAPVPAAALPVLLWIVMVLVASSPRPEGDVLLPGGDPLQWVSYGVLILGAAAGVVTIVRMGVRGLGASLRRESRSMPPDR